MEKYGFVYIWRDRKHKRFYIGSHWGTEDDGYICSSRWMRNAFARRPQDFKRRIICVVKESRAELLDKEYLWLGLIEKNELGGKYYNLTNHKNGHWTTGEEKLQQISEKIKHTLSKTKRGPTSSSFKPGEHHSTKTEFKKGQTVHNKNMTLEQRYGAEKAQDIKDKYSRAKTGKNNNSSTKFKIGQKAWNEGIPYTWITDGTQSKRLYGGSMPVGWYRGRPKNKRSFI